MADELNPLEQQVQDQFGNTPPDPTGGTSSGEGATEDGATGSEPVTTPPAGEGEGEGQASKVRVGDADYDQSELESLIEFQRWAQANQDRMAAFAAYLQGDADFVPKQGGSPAPPQGTEGEPPDPYADIDDPAVKAKLQDYDQRFAKVDTIWQQEQKRQLVEAESAVTTASDTIKDRYGLDDDTVRELQNEAAQLNIVPALRAQSGDMRTAVEKALDIAYWQNEEFRQGAIETEAFKQATEIERKARAGKITGTSGGTGRPDPANVKDMSEGDKRTAMANMIREAQTGTI